MSANIIGVSGLSHDSAACLLRDGKLVCAVEEERLSRNKHDPRFPWMAIRWCLEHSDLSLPDVDCVAFYERPRRKLARQAWMVMHPGATTERKLALLGKLQPNRVEKEIREALGYDGRVEFVDHHVSHAASSFYYSGFSEAALMIVDAVGEWTTTSYGRAAGTRLELFKEVAFPHSLGMLYSAITAYLGFDVNGDEYKVMGLAPYGRPIYLDRLRQLIEVAGAGEFRLNLRYFDFLRADRMCAPEMTELLGEAPRVPESEIRTFHKDVARSIQALLEEILVENARWLGTQVPSRNLCMAGGVALNCVANTAVLKRGPFAELFVQPAATDAGGALGAAAIAHIRLTGDAPHRERLRNVYLGPSYAAHDVACLIRATSLRAFYHFPREQDLLDAVVARLSKGKVIGWFHGAAEFGPRALGARSILADPRDPWMRDRINELVKMREAFRPFAPAVLESHAKDHFDLDHASPFMLETCQVTSKLELPAITHVDRSARPQTVSPGDNPRFFRLLESFHAKTGCPILLNTSFNVRAEPIVCSPLDAIRCFIRSAIDSLVLEDYVLDRENIPNFWELTSSPAGNHGIEHDVYTLF